MAENINYPDEEPNVIPTITPRTPGIGGGPVTIAPTGPNLPSYPARPPKNPIRSNLGAIINLDPSGNVIPTPLEGEIIELQKRHYDQASVSELLDRGFSEIFKSKDKLTVDNFFNLYQELFYDLPQQGKRSHTYLIEESTKYIGGYEDPKDDKINSLIDKLTEIETAQIEIPSEHPLFRNGTAIRYGTSLGIMQEGHLRSVSNQKNGDEPSPYQQLKRTLGLISTDGRVLGDKESYTVVTEQTWNSLPKWPEGTKIDEVADWSLTLSQFNIAESNITTLKESVKTSELDQFEINFLINELENKTPYLGITLEDNFNGNIVYGPTDLLPFGFPGNYQMEGGFLQVFYQGGAGNNNYWNGDARKVSAQKIKNSIIQTYEVKDYKGMYDIDLPPEAGLQGDTYQYGVDFQSTVLEDLAALIEEINENQFMQYRWQTDPERSPGIIIDGEEIASGQFYWVKYNVGSYRIQSSQEVFIFLNEKIAQYENINWWKENLPDEVTKNDDTYSEDE
tara:strand:+ start:7948 stop:9468 length:1521 start_codon:yes stop_codon:yes gene_type:complete